MAFEIFSLTGVSFATAILAILLGSYLVASIGIVVYNLFWHPLVNYPGPVLRAAFHFPDAFSKLRGTAYKDIKLLHDKYGSVVRIQPDALSYNSAQAWKDIYGFKADRTEIGRDPAHYPRSDSLNILVANQTDHQRIRRLLAHGFTDVTLLEQEPLLTFYFDLLVSKLKEQVDGAAHGRVDIMAYYNFTTFDIIGDLSLGESFGALEGGKYHPWMRNMFEAIKFLGMVRFAGTYPAAGLLLKVLLFFKPSFSARRSAHLAFTKEKIVKRLERKTDRKDMFTYILSHNNERGMTQSEIIANSRIILLAGSETNASLLSGATYYLLQNPDCLRRAQSELRTVFDKEEKITLSSVSTPNLLPYLEAVIHESMRCYPSVPATLPRRTGPEGATIDGKFVPGKTSIGVHQWSTYQNEANFHSPTTFAPERWLPDPPPEFRHDDKAALQPFSLGPRGCLGKSLAYFELRSILARILWNFDMEIEAESQDWTAEQKEYTIWDKPSLWIRLKHRGNVEGKALE